MNLDRRSVLKSLLIVAGGVTFIPSCLNKEESKTSIQLKNLDLTGKDEQLLADLTETIIPKTDTPGAKDTYTHLYLLIILDDCRTKEEQKDFEKGLKTFDKYVRNITEQPFTKLTPAQKEEMLKKLELRKDVPEEVLAFYKTVKRLTIEGYTTSKFYFTNVQVYELTPGRFKGCIPANETQKAIKKVNQHV